MDTMEIRGSDHIVYPNPALREATVFIGFSSSLEKQKFETIFADFHELIGTDDYPFFFPSLDQVTSVGTSAGIGEGRSLKTSIRYRSQYSDMEIGFDGFSLAVSVISTYKGWESLQENFLNIWAKTKELTVPERVTSIGLRYSNHIYKRGENENLSDWLVPSTYVPMAVLQKTTGESNAAITYWRSVKPLTSEYTALVFGASNADKEKSIPGSFHFEINCFRFFDSEQNSETLLEQDRLRECVNEIHEEVWNIFSASKDEALERLLQGEIL